MTKLVALRSIEHGARRAIAILGDQGVEGAIESHLGLRRSASLIRKCADPDEEGHHLQCRYAVALDVACRRLGELPPLLDVHRYLIDRHGSGGSGPEADGPPDERGVLHAVLGLQAALGSLSQTVDQAMHEEGPGGARLTNLEKHEIHEALEAVGRKTEAIKRLVAA